MQLLLDGVDVTDKVKARSLKKDDYINYKVDTLVFTIESYAGNSFTPEAGVEVELIVDGDTEFAGTVMKYSESIESDKLIRYNFTCRDFGQDADRLLIQEQFENETVDYIIDFLVTNYAPTFTIAGVNCPIVIPSITFDRLTITEALDKLSKRTNYVYYIDYNRGIHFFEKNNEPAPFNLEDDNDTYIQDSLEITRDISQIRNQVYIRGGEVPGVSRSEQFNGDGTKLTFVLGNKFAEKPSVTVGGVSKTVGIDYVDLEASFDCFWSFKEKYIRFKSGTVPGVGTNNIVVTGIPLFVLVMRVQDPASIAQYGVYEFAAQDPTIKTREEAKAYGIAQLEAYANSIVEGSFKTYNPGLRSGQLINVSSVFRGWNEDFLIQKVNFQAINPDNYIYSVQLATLRTMGIIDYLINQLKNGETSAGDTSVEFLEKVVFADEEVIFEEETATSLIHNPQSETVNFGESTDENIDFGTQFVLGPHPPSGPSDTQKVFILDGSRLV